MLNFLHRLIRNPIVVAVLLLGGAWWVHAQTASYGPYRVIGYNYTDRSIALFTIDGFGAGGSNAHESGGGGGTVCCMSVPRNRKTWHIKIVYELTREQYKKDLPNDVYETDIPVPSLPNRHDGYIEFHFLPDRKIEAKWVDYPTDPRNMNTMNKASSTTN
ncbi:MULTISPECIES: DUF3304 domain-containing protein [Burkholderia]|uniref:DUF3304 domain-containing protein n=1 Tax=Burkholderia TaxID=32008 RepID=UPI00158C9E7B|nr:DUF3304 domain-containing protein [Burkholderia ambifaria]